MASDVRAAVVLVGAVVVGGVSGFGSRSARGRRGRWANTQLKSLGSAIGALGLGLRPGGLLLRTRLGVPGAGAGPADRWPGAHFGAGALVLAPLLLLAGELVRSGHYYFFPAQLAAMVDDPATILTSYALYTAGLVLLIPAFLALAGMIGRERPGWAFWGATIAVVGSAVRIFQEGISFLALQLVGVQGLEAATAAVGDTYGAWYVLETLNGSDNIAWAMLAIGAYRARVLGWVPALGVAFMITHYSGVLKGTDLNSLTGAVLLAAALVPLGVSLWRRAEPVSRRGLVGRHRGGGVPGRAVPVRRAQRVPEPRVTWEASSSRSTSAGDSKKSLIAALARTWATLVVPGNGTIGVSWTRSRSCTHARAT